MTGKQIRDILQWLLFVNLSRKIQDDILRRLHSIVTGIGNLMFPETLNGKGWMLNQPIRIGIKFNIRPKTVMENQQNTVVRLNCAVCRQQRRRCDVTCPYAPFFPPHCFADYQKARKLFGTSTIMRMMGEVGAPELKRALADSLLAEGRARAEDPVMGGFGIVRMLRWQIQFYQTHLEQTRREIAARKEANARERTGMPPEYKGDGLSTDIDLEAGNTELRLFEPSWLEHGPDRTAETAPADDVSNPQSH
ncbi:PREDICTED: LOB domain-containing protein 13-like [Tarenaya hassleriana]|uniref:LOB domain-containing protein 13-like n=1 Tax=Tarenaya hassleriana TaxID=28532 RepID=UPI00053C3F4E|nr:PREDICTED: LOB domain-containing protein 13-like [Tarenaya hassleriana]